MGKPMWTLYCHDHTSVILQSTTCLFQLYNLLHHVFVDPHRADFPEIPKMSDNRFIVGPKVQVVFGLFLGKSVHKMPHKKE